MMSLLKRAFAPHTHLLEIWGSEYEHGTLHLIKTEKGLCDQDFIPAMMAALSDERYARLQFTITRYKNEARL